jgi:hypothetical protein
MDKRQELINDIKALEALKKAEFDNIKNIKSLVRNSATKYVVVNDDGIETDYYKVLSELKELLVNEILKESEGA